MNRTLTHIQQHFESLQGKELKNSHWKNYAPEVSEAVRKCVPSSLVYDNAVYDYFGCTVIAGEHNNQSEYRVGKYGTTYIIYDPDTNEGYYMLLGRNSIGSYYDYEGSFCL